MFYAINICKSHIIIQGTIVLNGYSFVRIQGCMFFSFFKYMIYTLLRSAW